MPEFDPNAPANQLSQKVEHEVRKLIGDLNMQIIVLKGMLELAQQQPQQPQQPPMQPPVQPPVQPPPAQSRANGVHPLREVSP